MKNITFEFQDDTLAGEFWGWFLDGGGDDTYHDAMDCRGQDVTIKWTKPGQDRVITITNRGD